MTANLKDNNAFDDLATYFSNLKLANSGEVVSSGSEETLTITSWNATAEKLLCKCPFEKLTKVDKIKKFLLDHKDGSVTITMRPSSLNVCMKQKNGSSSSFSGTWS